jgi:hypothetical protein
VDEQIQVVLAVLKGELSLAEAARRHGVSSATEANGVVDRWLCDPTRPSTNAHHARLTSPSNTASVWPLADRLLDWEVLT